MANRQAILLQCFATASAFCGLVAALAWPGTAVADEASVEVSGTRFVFQFADSDRSLVAALDALAGRAWPSISADLNVGPLDRITVVLAADNAAFNDLQPPGRPLPEWASGVAYPDAMTMVIRTYHVPGTPRQDMGTIFVHELTHLVLGARFGAQRVPFWLHEGLAMYEAGEWRLRHEWDLMRAGLAGRTLSLHSLTGGTGMSEAEARIAYALSQALVGHMIATYGREAFGGLVDELAAGASLDEALIRAFGVAPELFESRWQAYLDRRYTWVPLLTSSTALWLLLTAVTVAAFAARRRRNRRIMAAWEEEERMAGPPQP